MASNFSTGSTIVQHVGTAQQEHFSCKLLTEKRNCSATNVNSIII